MKETVFFEFEPDSIVYLGMFLDLLYIPLLLLCIFKLKLQITGILMLILSFILYLHTIYVFFESFDYADKPGVDLFASFEYFHLIILVWPYVFLAIAIRFSEKRILLKKNK